MILDQRDIIVSWAFPMTHTIPETQDYFYRSPSPPWFPGASAPATDTWPHDPIMFFPFWRVPHGAEFVLERFGHDPAHNRFFSNLLALDRRWLWMKFWFVGADGLPISGQRVGMRSAITKTHLRPTDEAPTDFHDDAFSYKYVPLGGTVEVPTAVGPLVFPEGLAGVGLSHDYEAFLVEWDSQYDDDVLSRDTPSRSNFANGKAGAPLGYPQMDEPFMGMCFRFIGTVQDAGTWAGAS